MFLYVRRREMVPMTKSDSLWCSLPPPPAALYLLLEFKLDCKVPEVRAIFSILFLYCI